MFHIEGINGSTMMLGAVSRLGDHRSLIRIQMYDGPIAESAREELERGRDPIYMVAQHLLSTDDEDVQRALTDYVVAVIKKGQIGGNIRADSEEGMVEAIIHRVRSHFGEGFHFQVLDSEKARHENLTAFMSVPDVDDFPVAS